MRSDAGRALEPFLDFGLFSGLDLSSGGKSFFDLDVPTGGRPVHRDVRVPTSGLR